ncbi:MULTISPECIES: DUF445 family protein [unclassified Thermosipho (in: thermotogales)]|uniref:DUF445 domain-containing protein n=1 Tax=unclassified Thermosipho (in: thermotogales) TaxID=2676525 RepID=UPI00098462E7|nr:MULTISPECIES: DUF445 family protein [unclassified Thermosipho (in: thermotogales)]MBT1247263.1 hypothetical protein [Thermosipho sp. 1244]
MFFDLPFLILLTIFVLTKFIFHSPLGILATGALVGYITNMLAIWMLFNPKRKILGIQGVIPRKKYEIAQNLSRVIEDEFINTESLKNFMKRNLDQLNFKDDIMRFIVENFSKLLNEDTKNSILRYLSSKISIPLIPVDRIVSSVLDNVFKDIKVDLESKGSIYKMIEKNLTDGEYDIIKVLEKVFERIPFKDIVREKIENYTVDEIETVILKIAKRELRYIELLGIPLGILISIIQMI